MLEVNLLGNGGTRLTSRRYLTQVYIRNNEFNVLIDCGEGTQRQIEKLGLQIPAIDVILLTHIHGDHTYGLLGLIQSMDLAERRRPLMIASADYSIIKVVEGLLKFQTHKFQIVYKNLYQEEEQIKLWSNQKDQINIGDGQLTYKDLTITPIKLRHSVPTFGYVFNVQRLAKFDRERAIQNGIPIKYWNALQHGKSVRDDSGNILTPQMVLGDSRKGVKFVYATDSSPCKGLVCSDVCDADLYILECMYTNEDDRRKAVTNRHLMIDEQVEVFKRTNPKKMVLTHLQVQVDDVKANCKLMQLTHNNQNIKIGKAGDKFELNFID